MALICGTWALHSNWRLEAFLWFGLPILTGAAANCTVVISFKLSNVKNHILMVYTSHKNARIGDGGSYCFTSITRIGWRNQVITDPRSTKVSYMWLFCLLICANLKKGRQILGSREAWNVRVGRKGPFMDYIPRFSGPIPNSHWFHLTFQWINLSNQQHLCKNRSQTVGKLFYSWGNNWIYDDAVDTCTGV